MTNRTIRRSTSLRSTSRRRGGSSYGAEVGIVYPGREIYICGKDLNLGPYAQVALQVNYPVHATTWDCEIVSTARDEIIVFGETPSPSSLPHISQFYINNIPRGSTGRDR